MDFSFSDLNFNFIVTDNVAMLPSIENLPGFEARAAFTVNSAETIARYFFDFSQIIRNFVV